MTKYRENYTYGLKINDIRNKLILSVQPNMKRGASRARYEEMEAYWKRRSGKATIGDVLDNTSYTTRDFSYDIRHGHIKVAGISALGPDSVEEMLGSALDVLLAEEGGLTERVIRVRSRSGSVREFCIEKHGSRCFVCKLDFGERFGETFANLIDVHHKDPIAQRDGSRITNPESDCVPLCPNCHRMAHFGMPRGKCRSLDELLELVGLR